MKHIVFLPQQPQVSYSNGEAKVMAVFRALCCCFELSARDVGLDRVLEWIFYGVFGRFCGEKLSEARVKLQ